MATFEVDVDGATYEVDAPDENTAWQWANETHKQAKPKQSTLSQVGEVAGNFGKGALSGAADIGNTLINASSYIPRKIGDVAANAMGVENPLEEWNQHRQSRFKDFNDDNKDSTAFSLGRTGANIAGTLGVGGGAGSVLASASKTPRALQLANALKTGGMAQGTLANKVMGGAGSAALGTLLIDPESTGTSAAIGGTIPLIGKAAPAVGGAVADVIGGLGTHTGGESLRTAAASGLRGGKAAESFAKNMRGQVPIDDVLTTAKQNLQAMGADKAAQYRQGMASVSNDKTVLSLGGVDDALDNAFNTVTFKGQGTNEKGVQAVQKMRELVDNWKNLDPAEYHTPEGLDALKRQIGGIQESIPFEEKTARKVAGEVYNSIKSEISKQAPDYADTMKGYSQASEQIAEIEKALSLGNKASADTAMRKLQSLTRNNVSTNYGNRLDMAKALEQQGGQEIMPALAGQSLSSITPRGLGGAVAGATGVGAAATLNPALLAALVAQSPRLMGEAALKTGQGARLVQKGAKKLTPSIAAMAAALNRE
jgi:hypothetical protein